MAHLFLSYGHFHAQPLRRGCFGAHLDLEEKKGGQLLQSALPPRSEERRMVVAERVASYKTRKDGGCCGARCVQGEKEEGRLLWSALRPRR